MGRVFKKIRPCFCTVPSGFLQFLSSSSTQAESLGQVRLRQQGTPKNTQVGGGSVPFEFSRSSFINSWPVNCPREQISGPLVDWDYRPFRSSLGRCIHPAPSWKYSSSCQWSSACRSATMTASVLHTSAHNCINSIQRAVVSVLLTGSHFPMSPVCSHPSSSSASAVFSGSFRYPLNTFGPLTHTYKEISFTIVVLVFYCRSLQQSSWAHLSLPISCKVAHFWHIHQFHVIAG